MPKSRTFSEGALSAAALHQAILPTKAWSWHGPEGLDAILPESAVSSSDIYSAGCEVGTHLSEQRSGVARWLPLIAIAISSVCFALQALSTKKVSLAGVPTFEILVIRGTIQMIGCCLSFAAIRRPPSTWMGETRQEVGLLCCRALIGFCGAAFGFTSVTILPLAESQVLGQMVPIFASLYAWIFLGERWHCSEAVSAVLGICGVVLIANPSMLLHEQATDASTSGSLVRTRLIGITCSLLGAACAGGAFVFVRLLGTRVKVHWLLVLSYQAIGQVVLGSLVLKINGQSFTALDWPTARWAVACGVLGFCGQSAMTWGMQREKSATASVVQKSLSPVSAILLQSIFFPADGLQLSTLVGFVVIFFGLVVTVIGKMHREVPSESPSRYQKL